MCVKLEDPKPSLSTEPSFRRQIVLPRTSLSHRQSSSQLEGVIIFRLRRRTSRHRYNMLIIPVQVAIVTVPFVATLKCHRNTTVALAEPIGP